MSLAVLVGAQIGDVGSPIGGFTNEALDFEFAQRFAQGRLANTEARGQLLLHEPLAPAAAGR